MDPFEFTRLVISPEISPIEEAVKLTLEFKTSAEYKGVTWQVSYVVDSIGQKVKMPLLKTTEA